MLEKDEYNSYVILKVGFVRNYDPKSHQDISRYLGRNINPYLLPFQIDMSRRLYDIYFANT